MRMKINLVEDPLLEDITLSIACPAVDRRVRRIIEAAEVEDMRLVGVCNGYLRAIPVNEVLYVESVDGSAFFYTEDAVVESSLTLTELESELAETEFIRVSRQMLVNLSHVRGLRPYLNARLELVLDNGEKVIASRQYSPAIKSRIGI